MIYNLKKFFLVTICFILFITSSFSSPLKPSLIKATEALKPNILFILTDDQDMNLGSLDYMPNLKKLISDEGAFFENYFVNMSLCCPSRSTILRGQNIHNHGVISNSPPTGGYEKFFALGDENSTIGTWLQSAGYRTGFFGKYLNGYPLPKEKKHVPKGWNMWCSPNAGNPYSSYNYDLNINGKTERHGKKPVDYITDVISEKTNSFINQSIKSNQPFFAYVATYAPHGPSNPAPRHLKLFNDLKAPRLPNFNEEDIIDKPLRIAILDPLTKKQIDTLDEQFRNRVRSLQAVDEMIARFVKTLEERNQLDNTYIFFTSDNGFHLGEHRLLAGKLTEFEEDLRVPLIVRGPGITKQTLIKDFLTGNTDLAPTFAEIAGAQTPDFVDGRSLIPVLKESWRITRWRKAYLIEQLTDSKEETLRSSDLSGTLEPKDEMEAKKEISLLAFTGLRTMRYKYVELLSGEVELYDLSVDPYELQNIAKSADKELLKYLHESLSKLRTSSGAGLREIEESLVIPGELNNRHLL